MIEVGEYVRTKNGKIDKIINNNCYMPQYIECEKSIVYKEDIVKHSKIISEVVEIGDYVNGMKIDDIGEIKRFGKTAQKCLWVNIGDGIDIIDEEIKDILTKEQYQANCYTVERKEEC